MHWFILAFALTAISQEPKTVEVEASGLKRTALVFAPSKMTETTIPLVLVYHGHGGTARAASRSMPFHKVWPEALVVYPQGVPTPGQLTDPEGKKTGWQPKAGDFDGRDLKFYDQLLKDLKAQYKIGDIFVTGHSNGGGFTYLLWANRAESIRAIAPCAAGGRSVLESKPIPVMHIAGRKDPLVKFEMQERVMKAVRRVNQCEDRGQPWAKDCTLYSSKINAPFIAMIHDGDHKYPSQAPELIVKFFKEQAKSNN